MKRRATRKTKEQYKRKKAIVREERRGEREREKRTV